MLCDVIYRICGHHNIDYELIGTYLSVKNIVRTLIVNHLNLHFKVELYNTKTNYANIS